MRIFQGKGVSQGIAFGRLYILQKPDTVISGGTVRDAEAEWARYLEAKKSAAAQLLALYEKTGAEVGAEAADIIEIQRLMLEDGDFNEAIESMILKEHRSAPYAVSETGRQFAGLFASMDDPYMKNRATDVSDLAQRVTDVLLSRSTAIRFDFPVIVAAEDLTPSETLQMDKSKVRAFVIRQGSGNSHTAILARTMNIPCIVQADIPLSPDLAGNEAAVDGTKGMCWLEPDEPTRAELLEGQRDELARRKLLDDMRGLPTITKRGRRVRLYANIGGTADIPAVLGNDCEGIGLFRSEFLYLGRDDYPSEEELFEAYREVAEAMDGKQVIIRTLDIGADKKVGYFNLDSEENPALGLRGVRICLDRPELFKTQLRAIYRAAAFGNIAVMFPIITSVWEVRLCKEIAAEAQNELCRRGVPVGTAELGIMVETPASVMVADNLAKEVDFFSVGTNDLTQYTLAVDRQNNKLWRFYDPYHPAVMEMLRIIAEAARRNGIWAGICGELAADTAVTKTLIDMGYGELSASPSYTLNMRRHIREME